jgi:hypothetical protein
MAKGVAITGISPLQPPYLRWYDPITMENPFNGFCEGAVIAPGWKRGTGLEGADYICHTWNIFENGTELLNRSCGSPILKNNGNLVGIFRFQRSGDNGCLAVARIELNNRGSNICVGERQL